MYRLPCLRPLAALVLATFATPLFAAADGYAERLYADYSAATTSKAQLVAREVTGGALADLAGLKLADIVGTTRYSIEADEGALTLSAPHFGATAAAVGDDSTLGVDGFDAAGWPVAEGTYRVFEVEVVLGKEQRTHRAVEFCWAAKHHCVVYDPSILFIDSVVNGQRELKASGWGAVQNFESAAPSGTRLIPNALAAHCGLASNPAYVGRSLTWGAYTRTYKNVYGVTMVTKNMGAQQAGLRCNSSCQPAPFGYSNASSAFANVPFSVDCDHAFGSGTTGRTGKFDAETKCAHRLVFSAKVDVSVENRGSAAVDIKWDTTGSVDGNGGHYIDTCGYF